MTKPKKKTHKTVPATAEGVLDVTFDGLHAGATYLRKRLDVIIDGKGGKSRFDTESRVAHLMTKLGSTADSLRKVQAARAKQVDRITKAQAMAWLRTLDVAERSTFLREAQRIDEEGSVLA